MPNAFDGKTDFELLKEIRRTSGELVRRFELQLDLTPSRPEELDAAKDKLHLIRMSERELRGLYEQCRDLRETIEEGTADWEEYESGHGADDAPDEQP